jgi:8-oxo-dGTP diphosphatase
MAPWFQQAGSHGILESIMNRLIPTANDERAFLETYNPGDFERPSVTVDLVLLAPADDGLETLVIRRPDHPHRGRWALPGGFVGITESLEVAALRILKDKTGLRGIHLEQLYTFGDPRRDPRMRILSVAHMALVPRMKFEDLKTEAGQVARVLVPWEGEDGGPVALLGTDGKHLPLAFDHEEIIALAIRRLRGKINYSSVAFQLLPRAFTLFQLQQIHEAVLGRPVNKDSFRRRMIATGLLVATGDMQDGVGHRPATLYRLQK